MYMYLNSIYDSIHVLDHSMTYIFFSFDNFNWQRVVIAVASCSDSSFKDQYPALFAIKLQSTILISHHASGPAVQSANIQEIDCVTNEIVLELHHFKDKHQCTCFMAGLASCMIRDGPKSKLLHIRQF